MEETTNCLKRHGAAPVAKFAYLKAGDLHPQDSLSACDTLADGCVNCKQFKLVK